MIIVTDGKLDLCAVTLLLASVLSNRSRSRLPGGESVKAQRAVGNAVSRL